MLIPSQVKFPAKSLQVLPAPLSSVKAVSLEVGMTPRKEVNVKKISRQSTAVPPRLPHAAGHQELPQKEVTSSTSMSKGAPLSKQHSSSRKAISTLIPAQPTVGETNNKATARQGPTTFFAKPLKLPPRVWQVSTQQTSFSQRPMLTLDTNMGHDHSHKAESDFRFIFSNCNGIPCTSMAMADFFLRSSHLAADWVGVAETHLDTTKAHVKALFNHCCCIPTQLFLQLCFLR